MRRSYLVISVAVSVCFFSGVAARLETHAAARDIFLHPGLLQTESQLERFSARSAASDVVIDTYKLMQVDPRSSGDYQPQAQAVVDVISSGAGPSEKAFKDDAIAAYLNAMLWVKTGDSAHRDKAIEILNVWASTFKTVTTDVSAGNSPRQPQLEAAWTLPMWVNAAEIIRYYDNGIAGWKPENIDRFDIFVDRLFAFSSQSMDRKSNWGASASMAAVAVGVYQNDRKRYKLGLESIKKLMPAVISEDGEINELRTRDCSHPQYSLAAFVQAAAIAGNQGDQSLWLFGQTENAPPLLARGLEYMAEALSEGSPVRDCQRLGHMGKLGAGYGSIALQEYQELGILLPKLRKVVQSTGVDKPSYQFLGWSSATYILTD